MGRYTFFGVDPFQVIASRGDRITVTRGARRTEETGNIFEFLRREGARYRSVALPGLPPFTAGAVGYLAYEAVRRLERLPPRVEMDVDVDDAVFMYFSNLVAFDHVQHRLFLIANVLTEEGKGTLRAKYDAAVRQLAHMESLLRRPLDQPRAASAARAVARASQHVAAGATKAWWSAPRNTSAPATSSRWCFRSAWKCPCAFPPSRFIAPCAP